jgi:hypothetical protein
MRVTQRLIEIEAKISLINKQIRELEEWKEHLDQQFVAEYTLIWLHDSADRFPSPVENFTQSEQRRLKRLEGFVIESDGRYDLTALGERAYDSMRVFEGIPGIINGE